MTKKIFNFKRWSNMTPSQSVDLQIKTVTSRIVAAQTDITGTYEDWYAVGCIIAEQFGEAGRALFHDISRFHPIYDQQKCDKQYNACLCHGGQGYTPATLFKLAKDHGIKISDLHSDNARPVTTSPIGEKGETGKTENFAQKGDFRGCSLSFSEEIEDRLPPLFADIAKEADTAQTKDMLLFGSIIALSSVYRCIVTHYGRSKVHTPLFGFYAAPAASNKGLLTSVTHLLTPIEDELRRKYAKEQEEYQKKQAEYLRQQKKHRDLQPPTPPVYRSTMVPANSSTTAVYQLLSDNGGWGLTFESEGDTLTNSIRQDYGNYSDGMRKAFQEERISYNRRKDNEHVDISQPHWAILLSGTPAQIRSLIPDAENGLHSRFLFLTGQRDLTWHNVFDCGEHTLNEAMEAIGQRVYSIYFRMQQLEHDIVFQLTKSQQQRFNDYFSNLKTDYYHLQGDAMISSVHRLGLSCVRIMMVLATSRLETMEVWPETLECTDDDFDCALTMADTLMAHCSRIYSCEYDNGSEEDTQMARMTEDQKALFRALPSDVKRKEAIQIGAGLNIVPKTVDKYMDKYVNLYQLMVRVKNGIYRKVEKSERQNADSSN